MRLPTPTVPVSTQSVGQFAAPTVAPMQDATGQQFREIGQSLESAGAVASRIGADLQADLDQGFLMEADAKASESITEALGAYRQQAGLGAIDSFEGVHKALKDRLTTLGETARSPNQRRNLDRMLAQRFQDASDAMVTHRNQEIRGHAIGGTDAGRKAAILDYHNSLGNPEDMALARELAMQRTAKLAELKGYGPDQARLAMLDTTTQMHLGTVDAMLVAGRTSEAAAYMEQWKGEIDPTEARKAAAVVKQAGIADKAQRVTMMLDDGRDIMAKVNDTDQLFANGELTVEERDAVVNRLKAADGLRYEQRNRAANRALAEATDFASLNRIQSVDQLPPYLITQLKDVGELDKVQLFLDQGGQFNTTRLGLSVLNSITPEQLRRIKSYDDLEAMFRAELNNKDLEELAARWRQANAVAAKPGDEEKIDRGLVLRNAARDGGFYPVDRDPTDAEKAKYDRYVEAALRESNSRFGGKATNEQFRTVAREMAFDTLIVGGNKVPFAAATKEELQTGYMTAEGRAVFNKNVSEETKNQILQAIDVYNAEAAKKGLAQKPRTMAQVFTEWEKLNVMDRAQLLKNKQAVRAEVFKDKDVLRVYHRVLRDSIEGGRGSSQRAYEQLVRWQTESMRWNSVTMTKAEWLMHNDGLSASQYAELLRVAESEARTREER